ncbi:MAG: hypothetical protein AABW84_00230 [Nanoarchaeota archaeon]
MAELPLIKARIIIEVAGWPEEHITSTLNLVKEKFGGENVGIAVKKATIREPKKISDRAYSGFVEFEFTAKRMTDLVGVVFDWMPSSVEIIEPVDLLDTNANFSDLLNDLSAKLHQYDALIKKLKSANILLQRDVKRLDSKILSANEEIKELKKELKNSE